MRPADAAFGEVGRQFGCEFKTGAPGRIVHHADVGQCGRRGHADAERLAQRLLGGEALGEKTRGAHKGRRGRII